jgi:hypothetical protein
MNSIRRVEISIVAANGFILGGDSCFFSGHGISGYDAVDYGGAHPDLDGGANLRRPETFSQS